MSRVIPFRGRRTQPEPDRLRTLLLHLLVAPWTGAAPYARTTACIELDHPRPSPTYPTCVCGSRKYEAAP